ncbi:M23 family metallopeptidase [Treponema parvum]|uniref:M23 family metallopeptidase n=1 Tax=Treponema parvum TaxID=138851 RepID=UPI001AEC693E|nr:M23 family metallopeptidase [Treponema parvum]QTQ15942.1 LysM peptidoglycan-binding domain-containing protein [Treponema parvum]
MNLRFGNFAIKKTTVFFFAAAQAFLSFYVFADSTHTVSKGETLYAISRKYQITVAELRAANNMSESDVLKTGQKLTIPSADISAAAALTGAPVSDSSQKKNTKVYIVQKGDTFYGIARKNGIPLSELFALNGLGNDAVLKAGEKLLVPDSLVASADSGDGSGSGKKNASSIPASSKAENSNDQNKISETTVLDLKSADPRKYTDAEKIDTGVVWPVKDPKVTYVKGKVSGVQLSAKRDENVTAIRAGTVMYCGIYRGFGQVIFVQSKTGLIYAYTGLGSVEIQKGDYVVAGAQLGTVGIDTISMQPQMTLMVFQNGMPIDPAKAPRG